MITEQYPEFYEVCDLSSDDFKMAMKIYSASFPEAERRPRAAIEDALRRGKIHLIVGRIGGKVRTMALLYPVYGTQFVLVDYIATSQEIRGRGIGGKLLHSAFDLIDELLPDGRKFDYLLAEAENPSSDVDETRVRRIEFYRRLGMKELEGVRHLLPPMHLPPQTCLSPSVPADEPTEMRLMVLSRRKENGIDKDCSGRSDRVEDRHDKGSLDGREIKDVLTRIFQDLYCRGQEDEVLAKVLEEIPDRISLV